MVCVIIRTILREFGRAQEKLMPGVSNVIVGELIGSLSRDLVNALGKWESKNPNRTLSPLQIKINEHKI